MSDPARTPEDAPAPAGRTAGPAALLLVGVIAIGVSLGLPGWLDPAWFWPPEARALQAERDAHYQKLRLAYFTENRRRAAAGEPPLGPPPPAMAKAEAALAESERVLDAARRRPQEIATAVRYAGAACCVAGIGLLAYSRSKEAPSPSAGAEGRSARPSRP